MVVVVVVDDGHGSPDRVYRRLGSGLEPFKAKTRPNPYVENRWTLRIRFDVFSVKHGNKISGIVTRYYMLLWMVLKKSLIKETWFHWSPDNTLIKRKKTWSGSGVNVELVKTSEARKPWFKYKYQ